VVVLNTVLSAARLHVIRFAEFFFSGDLLGKRTADPERSTPTCYTPIDAVPAKEVPFGVSSIRLIPWGSYPRKTPHFWAPNGDSQLKRLRAYLGTG
jgi:hypothetical protein